MAQSLQLKINLRPDQLTLWRNLQRFNVLVCHRRFGKTFFSLARLVAEALNNPHKHSFYAYIAPTFTQAKRIAWLYLCDFTADIPGAKRNVSELSVSFPNGAVIRLLGAEQADSLRGIFCDGLVCDETALIPEQAWNLVLAPTLIDRRGWVIFIGTPATRIGLFYQQWEIAKDEPDYYRAMFTAEDTDIIPSDELARLKRTLRPAEYDQELLCSWDGAVLGSYYRDAMKRLIDEDRYGKYDYDATRPVYGALDLGYGDLTVWICWQRNGNRIHIIDCVAFEQTAIPEQVTEMRKRPHMPSMLILPHDAEQHSLESGKTRTRIFNQLGVPTVIAPKVSVHDGIEAVHDLLPHVYMDDRCSMLLEALIAYRANFDPVKNVHTVKPVHDWSSHYADAMRYLALGRDLTGEWQAIDYRRYNRGIV